MQSKHISYTYRGCGRRAIRIQYLEEEVEEFLHGAGQGLQDLPAPLRRNGLEGHHIFHEPQEHLQHQLCLRCLKSMIIFCHSAEWSVVGS